MDSIATWILPEVLFLNPIGTDNPDDN